MLPGVAVLVFIEYGGVGRDATHLVDRLPRFDSSNMHSWLPVWQRLHGGPCSAPTHFILRRRQTVQARLPRVAFVFGASDAPGSAVGDRAEEEDTELGCLVSRARSFKPISLT